MWSRTRVLRVGRYIAEHQLLRRDGRYLVALSGGADSVALLLLLQDLGYHIEAAHCNFHLRGEESDRDERFVVSLCQERGVELHRAHFDTREYATLHHVSIEMAARDLRYHYFEQLRQDLGFDGICVAHHRDDNVETVLMNLIRGTGLRGLQGIRPKNGYILRPLLCLSRQDIEHYLSECHQAYVTDSTNCMDDVVRNKIRLNVVPRLLDINPSAAANIDRTAAYVADAIGVYDEAIDRQRRDAVVEESDDRLVVDLKKLSSESLLFELLRPYGFPADTSASIWAMRPAADHTGKLFSSADYDLVVDRDKLVVERRRQPLKALRVPECRTYVFGREQRFTVECQEKTEGFQPSREALLVHLDAATVRFPLTLRQVQEGDWFVPFGMTGRKLVSDFLTDRKVNLLDKKKALVVCDATNAIVWLVGYRTDNRFRVSDETESVLKMNVNVNLNT